MGCGRFYGKLSRAVPALIVKEGYMTALIPTPHHSLISRRSIFIGAAASLLSRLPSCGPLILCQCAACHFRLGLSMQGSSNAYIFMRSKEACKLLFELAEPA